MLALFSIPHASAIAQDAVTIGDVTVGIEDHFRLGCWTQLRFQVNATTSLDSVRVEVRLPDGEGLPCVNVTEGETIPAGDSTVVTNLKFGRPNGDLSIRLLSAENQILATKYIPANDLPDAITANQFLVVSLGDAMGVEETLSLRKEKESQQTVHLGVSQVSDLPRDWMGYGGVNLVVVATSANSLAANMTSEQSAALKRWVQLGGRVILCAGAESEPVIAAGTELGEILPGTFDQVRMQRETSNFEGYAGNTRVSLSNYTRDEDASFRLPMAALRDVRGKEVLSEGLGAERTPAIVRGSYGFGHVVYLAVDLDLPPMAEWKDGRRRILKKLIDLSLGEQNRDERSTGYSQLTQIGFTDITGQLRGALDRFGEIVPFYWVAMLVGVYIVLIGPVDYFLLRRFKKRFGLTWITFPLAVLATCALAFWLTQIWKGRSLSLNQVNVVDVDAETGLLRGSSWGHVFSPTNHKYDLHMGVSQTVFPSMQQHGSLTGWQGLVGSSFGAMNTRTVQDAELEYQIVHAAKEPVATHVEDIPISIYGSRGFHGMAWGTVELEEMDALAIDIDNRIMGTVRNPLPVGLKKCQLFYGRRVYLLPSLAPGGSKVLGRDTQPKAIEVILTKKSVDQDFKDISQPWDRRSFDVHRIMQMMMFYNAAGGESYTSLSHRYQRDIDFSDHLTQGRAILVGQVSAPDMGLLESENAEKQIDTYVRILLPVGRKK